MGKQFTAHPHGESDLIKQNFPYLFVRTYQNDTTNSNVWYTSKVLQVDGKVVYGVLLQWPADGGVVVSSPVHGPDTVVTLLGWSGGPLEVTSDKDQGTMTIHLPDKARTELNWAWTLKFVHLENGGNFI